VICSPRSLVSNGQAQKDVFDLQCQYITQECLGKGTNVAVTLNSKIAYNDQPRHVTLHDVRCIRGTEPKTHENAFVSEQIEFEFSDHKGR